MKRIVSITVAVLLFLCFTQVYAENDSSRSITYEDCKVLLLKNNQTLKDIDYEVEKCYRQYRDNLSKSKRIELEGKTIEIDLPYPLGKQYYYINYNQYTQMLIYKQKELLPEQMKFMWSMAGNKLIETENALTNGLRNIYMAASAADSSYKVELKKFEVEKELYEQQKLSYSEGLLSELDMEEAEFNYLKAQKSLKAAQRNRENALRALNSYIGVPLDTEYSEIPIEEPKNISQYKFDTYLNNALKKRNEIVSLKEQIKLREAEKEIMERNTVHERYEEAEKEYADLLIDIDSLKLKLEKAKIDIEKEITDAYVDVINTGKNVGSLEKSLLIQQKNLEFYKQRHELGFISKAILDKIEIGVNELENGCRLALYDYNTKLLKLMDASGPGPGY